MSLELLDAAAEFARALHLFSRILIGLGLAAFALAIFGVVQERRKWGGLRGKRWPR